MHRKGMYIITDAGLDYIIIKGDVQQAHIQDFHITHLKYGIMIYLWEPLAPAMAALALLSLSAGQILFLASA